MSAAGGVGKLLCKDAIGKCIIPKGNPLVKFNKKPATVVGGLMLTTKFKYPIIYPIILGATSVRINGKPIAGKGSMTIFGPILTNVNTTVKIKG